MSITRIYTDEHTSKAFAYKDKTSIEELKSMMLEKLELPPEAGKDWKVIEKLEDGSTCNLPILRINLCIAINALDPQEKFVKILKRWKDNKGETKLWWVRAEAASDSSKSAVRKAEVGGPGNQISTTFVTCFSSC